MCLTLCAPKCSLRYLLGKLSYLSLPFLGTLHSDGYIFPFLLCLLLLFFSQVFLSPPQTIILTFLHFFFLGMVLITTSCTMLWKVKVSQSRPTLWLHGLYWLWNSPGQNTEVGSLSLLQGILPTQGSNPGLPHYRWILYQLSHKGNPRTLEWVAYPFSKGCSDPGT